MNVSLTGDRPRLAVLVLAAGAGSRFSQVPGQKLLAEFRGRPVLEHVLVAVRAFAPTRTVVVLGHGADAIEARVTWEREERIRNPDPGRGIASSVRVGFEHLAHTARPDAVAELDGTFIVLGDQPLLDASVLSVMAEESRGSVRDSTASIYVPRYAGTPGSDMEQDRGPRNPVLVLRSGWPLVSTLTGDRGFGLLIANLGTAVIEVAVPGWQPDVDTLEDLAALDPASVARE